MKNKYKGMNKRKRKRKRKESKIYALQTRLKRGERQACTENTRSMQENQENGNRKGNCCETEKKGVAGLNIKGNGKRTYRGILIYL